MTGQKKILIVLLAGLLLSIGYAQWVTPRQQRLPSADGAPLKNSRAATVTSEGASLQVHLHHLTRQEEAYGGYRRDLFAPLYRQAPPAPSPAAVLVNEVSAPSSPAEPEVSDARQAQEEIRQELARFTFLGFLQKDAEKSIFLSKGNDIFVVKKGDRFGHGRDFLVTHISNEILQIRQGDDPRIISVSLVEQAKLAQARSGAPSISPRPAALPQHPPERVAIGRQSLPQPIPLPPNIEEMALSPEQQGEDEEVKHE